MIQKGNIENIFVIGDVHGCYYTLMSLLQQPPNDAELIFVGDLCDKGNHSKDVVEFVMNNNHTCVYGNHEYLCYNYIRDAVFRDKHYMWTKIEGYGGQRTIKSYEGHNNLIAKHLEWFETLPPFIEIEKYFITHGFGLPYYQRRNNPDFHEKIVINRIEEDKFKYDWEDTKNYETINIFGHSVFEEVLKGKNYYGIDTGCVYGNKLTALQLGTMRIYEEKVDIRDI